MRSILGHPLGRPTDSQHTNPTSETAATSEQSATRSLGPVRRRIRLAMIAVIAGATLLVTAGAARADSFNPWPDSGVKTYSSFGDCNVTVGPVQDKYGGSAPGTFAVIGGVTVSCKTRHNLKAQVAEYYAPSGGAWRIVGQQNSTFFPNSYGFGSKILETSRICGVGGPASGWWLTRGWVWVTDASGNVSYGYYLEQRPGVGDGKSVRRRRPLLRLANGLRGPDGACSAVRAFAHPAAQCNPDESRLGGVAPFEPGTG